ncbi:response regulator [Candidatus Scalindua japonica]|uniref:Response regulator n=1 Tax=Candidatus Scalindua japonica TaxID=1284222 RepID=A0A286U4K9_9BACT|nr:sigma-54 dependent transcriptional regulator [Candidatus Scalindua japonica]GAX63062.1 response regulator [Candidatus Scalindua japonica]
MKKKIKLLFVDDDKTFSKVMRKELTRLGHSVVCSDCGEAAIDTLRTRNFEVIILDIKMPGIGGLQTLRRVKEIDPEVEVIMLTGRATIESAVESMKMGAYDYITKPCRLNELDLLLKKAYEKRQIFKENASLKRLASSRERDKVMISQSDKMKQLFNLINKVAVTGSTVLIQGESGTGKELVARDIHHKSERNRYPFVAVNCATLQDTLLESELFGHVKGAFTGAHETRLGLFEVADKGTLFLDEVGELPINIQAKLLRVLESGEIRRLGDSKVIFIDTRIITATNKDLASLVKRGSFREDLFFRINIVRVSLPPLRERDDDIPLLAQHFLSTHKTCDTEKKFSPDALECMKRYAWPGNIRELENFVEKMNIIVDDDKIGVCDLPEEIRGFIETEDYVRNADVSLSDLEKQHIINTMAKMNGNKTRVADTLGISIKTLYNKLKSYNIPYDLK